ncbi:hypothetical protein [uncultured Gilvimarinus sp.]|uniref:hypothetical protein n=1 Tax=uncultured Gilvimarinus sp. TaxID=1689143 RepID=UPI0030D9B7B4
MNLAIRQKGVALALLLWFIAALSLLVAGLMGLSRSEMTGAKLYLGQAKAAAVGDAAATMALQGLVQKVPAAKTELQGVLQFDAYNVRVYVVPTDGLVDVMAANAELLQLLFGAATDLEPAVARALADSVIQWRTPTEAQKKRRQSGPPVYVIEDVMAAPGLTRDIFEQVKWLICAGCNGGNFNSLHAPARLQNAVAGSSWSNTNEYEFTDNEWLVVPSGARIDVRVAAADGSVYQRSVWSSGKRKLGRRYRAFRVKQLEFESDHIVQ